MSERYIKRFSLSEQELPPIANIPVKIKAGAILQDNLQGVVLAQVKYENISNKSIKEMRVNIFAYDGQGRKIESLSNYKYERLSANVGDFFGDNLPVIMPDNNSYSFNVEVVSVDFSDGTGWSKFGEQAKVVGKESIEFATAFGKESVKVASAFGKEVKKVASNFGKEEVNTENVNNKKDRNIIVKILSGLWKIFRGFINVIFTFLLFGYVCVTISDMTDGITLNEIIGFVLFLSALILSIPYFARKILFKRKFGLKERVLRWVIIFIMFIINCIILF